MYRVMIYPGNEHGYGPYCKDILSVSTRMNENSILIIKAYDKGEQNSGMGCSYDHAFAIHKAGFGVDAISDEVIYECDIDFGQYDMIDYLCGDENDVMSERNKEFIKSYLHEGGKLFISGSQIIEGVAGSNMDEEFYNGYLKAKWKKSDARTYDVQTINTACFNGIEDFSFDDGSMLYDIERPDGFKVLGGAEANLFYNEKDSASYGVAGLQYTGTFGASLEISQLVYLGFPLESVTRDSLRDAMILCVLDYFDYDVVLTDIASENIPEKCNVQQNYPNPFNPITTVSFDLFERSHVDLSIYDMNGKKITTLFNGKKSAGHHTIRWDASKYSSGLYVYRLQADEYVGSGKMLLMK